MTREHAKREIDSLDYYLQNHTDDYSEESHTAMMMAISALEKNESAEEWYKLLCEKWDSAENKGEWIVREDNTSFVKQIPRRWVECSHCHWSFSYDRINDDFCSKCGADMRK